MSEANSKRKGFRWLLSFRHGPTLALLAIILLFTLLDWQFGSGRFFSMRNARVIMNSAALVAVPALGMTMIMGTACPSASRLSSSTLGVANRCHSVSSPPMPCSRYSTGYWRSAL